MGGRRRLVVVAEVDVDRLPNGGNGGGECRVRRLAATEVAERRGMVEVTDAHGAGPCRAAMRATAGALGDAECRA